MVRIFESDDDLRSKIAEYTNSQNAITKENLASLRKDQRALEVYLKDKKIKHVFKEGDVGIEDIREYIYIIDIVLFAQILISIKGYPEKATNQRKKLFDELYDSIFGIENLKIKDSYNIILMYMDIENWCNKFNDSLPKKVEIK